VKRNGRKEMSKKRSDENGMDTPGPIRVRPFEVGETIANRGRGLAMGAVALFLALAVSAGF
jgi:hypothetical protein